MPHRDDPSTKPFEPGVVIYANDTLIRQQYRINAYLGGGGMGIVYSATDLLHPRQPVRALKQTPIPMDPNPTSEQRVFYRAIKNEWDLMSRIKHRAVPRVFEFFEWEGLHFLVMDQIEGDTLRQALERTERGFDEAPVIEWALQICDIFEYLHAQRPAIIYRDTKIDNFMITPDNTLMMFDFGIARQVELGSNARLEYDAGPRRRLTELGTRGYAAPESFRGAGDARTDLYSLGVMLHVLLTRLNLDEIEVHDWQSYRPRALRPELSAGIEAIIMTCLEYQRERRWQSAAALRAALLRHVATRQPRCNSGQLRAEPPKAPPAAAPDESPADRATVPMPQLAWRYAAEGPIRSAPVVAGDLVYFGCHDRHLYAIQRANGELRGAFTTRDAVTSDPVVTPDAVLFGAEDGAIYAVDRALRRRLWTFQTRERIVSSPALLDDLLIIGADSGVVYALPLSGTEPRWRFETWGPVRGELATIGKLVIFGSHDEHIYALDAKGERHWHKPTHDIVDAQPIATRDGIIIGGYDRTVYALEPETGFSEWRHRLEERVLTGAASEGWNVYVGSADGLITCLDIRSGEEKWRYNVGSQITSDLLLRQQRLYFGCKDGSVYCLDLAQRVPLWRYQAQGAIVTRPALAGDLVIVASLDHQVYALRDLPMVGG